MTNGTFSVINEPSWRQSHRLLFSYSPSGPMSLEAMVLRGILDSAEDSILLFDPDGTILLANSTALKRIGKTSEEVVGFGCGKFLPPELAHSRMTKIRQVFQSEQPLLFEDELDGVHFQHSLCPARDHAGRVFSVIAFSRDVTQQKAAEEALKASQERLQLAVEASRTGIWEYHLGSGEYFWFEGVSQILRIPAEDVEPEVKRWLDYIHPDDRERLVADFKAAGRGENMWDCEFRIVCTDGTIRWAASRGTPVTTSDGCRKMIGVIHDITERKQAEESLAALNASLEERVAERTAELKDAICEQESFSYSVSHDLRAPLRHINCYSATLQEILGNDLSRDVEQCIGRIRAASERMGSLIDHLLQLSRISRAAVTRKMVNLSDIAGNIAALLLESEGTRRVEFVIADGIIAKCDPILIRQLLENLIHNAWKYSSGRAPAVIKFGREKVAGKSIFFIKDNGVGFDMAYSNKLFKVFERLHGAEFEGSGVGLATAQRIVSRHGGKIWAEGKVGEGAVFYFTLSPKTELGDLHKQCKLIL